MPDERIDTLRKSLDTMRNRLEEIERRRVRDRVHLAYALPACTVAGALAVLTASTWRTVDDGHLADRVISLWGMMPAGWQATVTMFLVLGLAIGTVGSFVGNASRAGHVVLVIVAVAALFAIAFLVGQLKTGFYAQDDIQVGAGRWLAALACVTLAVIHGARFSDLGQRH